MKYYTFTLDKPVLYYKGGEFISETDWQHKPMFHKGDYELICCIHGPLYLSVNDEEVTLQQNDVLIIPPYTKFEGFKPSTERIDFYWLHFFSQFQETQHEIADSDVSAQINSGSQSRQIMLPELFTISDGRQIFVLIHQILSIHNTLSFIDERDFLISDLLINLFSNFSDQLNPDDDFKFNYIKEWIRTNISAELTVQEIADAVHLNVDYMTRIFKKNSGMTTLQYLNYLKIEVAALLLVRTEMPVKQISAEAYFNDPKVFAKKFKVEMGLSPTAYRKSHNMIHHNNPHVDPQIPLPKRIGDILDYIPENGNIQENNETGAK